MGSGLSLTHEQVANIVERDLIITLNQEQKNRPRFTDNGYEIFYDYSDEVKLNNKINEIKRFVNSKPRYK
jgi:flagellar biosynthesis/type III secretory pathway chaperone